MTRLDEQCAVRCPHVDELEPYPVLDWAPGRVEYGWATHIEIDRPDRSAVPHEAVLRMDDAILRNFAKCQRDNPDLDLSNVRLVEGPITEGVSGFVYPRGWYAFTEPEGKG